MHATALVVGETGLLITGAPGSGKSRLALQFIQSAAAAGRFAVLVADDQVFVETAGERLVAVAPDTTAGLLEIRGSAIISVPRLRRAVVHIAIGVDPVGKDLRLPDPRERLEIAGGLSLPLLHLRPDLLTDPLVLLDAFEQKRLLL